MNINLKTLKGHYVYKFNHSRPWGIVSSVFLSPDNNKVCSLIVDTVSLIPLSYIVGIDNIHHINHNRIILRKSCTDIQCTKKAEPFRCISPHCNKPMKFHDISFDMESGEITDVTVSKTRLSKKNKISINNIYIKDNTIYIK